MIINLIFRNKYFIFLLFCIQGLKIISFSIKEFFYFFIIIINIIIIITNTFNNYNYFYYYLLINY